MRYVFAIALLLTAWCDDARPDALPGRIVFQLSCERTYFRIMSEYIAPKDLAGTAKQFEGSCTAMQAKYNMDLPAGLGCVMAIKQFRASYPDLPSKDELYDRFCKPIAEITKR